MNWIQLSIQIPVTLASALEDTFESAGALSVTSTDAEDQPLLEPGPGETPLWDQLIMTGLFTEATDIEPIKEQIRQVLKLTDIQAIKTEILPDQEWTRTWMDHFQPMSFGKRLWVCPEGFTPPEPDATNMRMDPGLAFGTGTHPTTALCLKWLDAQPLEGINILDYGCGSGILAIAALLLGATHADAVDNDPQALIATQDNAEKNQVRDKLQVFLPEQLPPIQADICIANILAGPLELLASTLAAHTRTGGKIVLSGILAEQANEVRQAYLQWFNMLEPVFLDDWTRLEGTRKENK